jgi:WD40 repeat protein
MKSQNLTIWIPTLAMIALMTVLTGFQPGSSQPAEPVRMNSTPMPEAPAPTKQAPTQVNKTRAVESVAPAPDRKLGKGLISSIYRSPENEIAILAHDEALHWYDGETMEALGSMPIKEPTMGLLYAVYFNQDSSLVVLDYGHGSRLVDLRNKKILAQLTADWFSASGCIFTSDNHYVVYLSPGYSSSGDNYHYISLYDIQEKESFSLETLQGGIHETLSDPALSPDEQLVAAGHEDGSIYVWEMPDGNTRYRLEGHLEEVTSVNFSPNGLLLASGSQDGTVRLWDLNTGTSVRKITGFKNAIASVHFLSDSELMVEVEEHPALIYDIERERFRDVPIKSERMEPDPLLERLLWQGYLENAYPSTIIFSPTRDYLAVVGKRYVTVWDIHQDQVVSVLATGDRHQLTGLAFSSDGEQLAGIHWDGTVTTWSLETGAQLLHVPYTIDTPSQAAESNDLPMFSRYRWLVYSPDGRRLLFPRRDRLEVWEVASKKQVLSIKTEPGDIAALGSFSPDGERIYAVFESSREAVIWNASSGEHLKTVNLPDGFYAKDLNGQLLSFVQSGEGIVLRLDLDSQRETLIRVNENLEAKLKFNHDGSRLYALSDHFHAWDIEKGQFLGVFHLPEEMYESAYRLDYDVSLNERYLLIGTGSGYLDLWELDFEGETQLPVIRGGPVRQPTQVQEKSVQYAPLERFKNGTIEQIKWSQDSTQIWTAGSMGVFEYSVEDANMTETSSYDPGGWIYDFYPYSSDNSLAAGTSGNGVKVWNIQNGQVSVDARGSQPVLSQDGKLVVFLGKDRNLYVYNTENGEYLSTLYTYGRSQIKQTLFSPDGRRLAGIRKAKGALTKDVIRIWDTENGSILDVFAGPGKEISSFSFSPDGSSLVSAAGSEIWIWNLYQDDGPARIAFSSATSHGSTDEAPTITAVTMSPHNGFVAAGTSDNEIYFLQRSKGKIIQTLTGHSNQIRHLRFSPNGALLASADDDGMFMIWHAASGRIISKTNAHAGAFRGMKVLVDGSLAVWNGGTMWKLKIPEMQTLMTTSVRQGTILSIRPQGDWIVVTVPYQIYLHDVQTGLPLETLEGEAGEIPSYNQEKFARGYTAAFFDPEGTQLTAIAPLTESVYVQDSSGKFTLTEQSNIWENDWWNYSLPIANSPDGRLVARRNGFSLQLEDGQSGEIIRIVKFSYDALPTSLVFSPDARTIFSGHPDGRISLIDVRTFEQVGELRGHCGSVEHLLFSSDGRYLISASADGTVRVWGVQ